MVTIDCKDPQRGAECAGTRRVLPQHARTVTRCVPCQTKFRQRYRNEKAKRQRGDVKPAI